MALYLTDWSPDNFAVSDSDGRLRLVDGEDLVLVDAGLIREERGPGWDVKHHHAPEDCRGGGLCYSTADLCTHAQSDLNLYGACAGLLAPTSLGFDVGVRHDGLLASPPPEVARKHPLFHRQETDQTIEIHVTAKC